MSPPWVTTSPPLGPPRTRPSPPSRGRGCATGPTSPIRCIFGRDLDDFGPDHDQKCTEREEQVKVAVLMGSPSDQAKMTVATATLQEFGVDADERIMSAHRTPAVVAEFARTARENGYAALICGAGMAAHLAGAVAAQTTLPVIGVPLSGGALNGVDALYATVQMPRGIPVATVAIDGAMNAAILVVQMLAITDAELAKKRDARRG